MRATLPLILVLVACQRDVKTPFPDGLEPLEEMAVDAPEGTSSDPYPESYTTAEGETDDGVYWAHVRGYFHHDIGDVWDLMRTDGPAMADRRDLDAWETTYDVEPELGLTFINHVTVNDIITLEWDMTYRGDLAGGDEEAPERYSVRFQKTEGSSLIDIQEGSVVLIYIEEGVTEFQFVERLQAPQTSPEDPRTYGEDMHETLATMLGGGEMPEWTE